MAQLKPFYEALSVSTTYTRSYCMPTFSVQGDAGEPGENGETGALGNKVK